MAPVSVVVPCFRCAPTVGRAIESVMRQTAPVQELILVDDCSNDGTAAVLQDTARVAGDVRIRLLALARNSGPATARNAGWDAATGDYVAFLDADDAWHPRKIELQHRFMAGHPELAFSGHAHRWLRGQDDTPQGAPAPGHAEVTRGALLFSNRFTTSSVMVRRAVAQRFRDGQRHMEDHLLWLAMVLGGLRAARLNAELSYRYFAPFGEAGLSADLFAMEREEISNYFRLWRNGAMGAQWLPALVPWSLGKFTRRALISLLRRAGG
jgi:glycosyltransferase involved in cell wall biosynthesis